MDRLPFCRFFQVKLAVRGAQPPKRYWSILELRVVGKRDNCAGSVELVQANEDVHVVAFGARHENPQLHVAGQFGVAIEGYLKCRAFSLSQFGNRRAVRD